MYDRNANDFGLCKMFSAFKDPGWVPLSFSKVRGWSVSLVDFMHPCSVVVSVFFLFFVCFSLTCVPRLREETAEARRFSPPKQVRQRLLTQKTLENQLYTLHGGSSLLVFSPMCAQHWLSVILRIHSALCAQQQSQPWLLPGTTKDPTKTTKTRFGGEPLQMHASAPRNTRI